eukprot:GEZU01016988.1.p1 GENE.GEZU01016988.1~~GEZU01016988.1.p1  ORF type:complete len:143 (-),score=28.82 GEZU01016988.1:52-480(-)
MSDRKLKFKDSSNNKASDNSSKSLFRAYGGGDGMTAYERHMYYIKNYVLFYGKGDEFNKHRTAAGSLQKTDYDVIRENYKFLGPDEEDEKLIIDVAKAGDDEEPQKKRLAWEKRLVAKYYSKLFREYCLADLSRYKEGKVRT